MLLQMVSRLKCLVDNAVDSKVRSMSSQNLLDFSGHELEVPKKHHTEMLEVAKFKEKV